MTESSTPASSAPKRERRRRGQPDTTEYRHRNRTIHVPEGHMAIGRIVGMHGLNGEMRVELHTDFAERFAVGETILLGQALLPRIIRGSREHKGMILLTLAEVTDRDGAEALRDEWLFIPDDAAMELPAGEYWVHDIIGLAVVDETGQAIGRVADVIQTGANDVYILTPAEGVNRGKELLIPAIANVVQAVDIASGTMTIHLVPGLLEE
ncbi:MAG: 16S rRNA processing protein RimM [Caldilineaceae bacterium]|nr:16S rRNA processing protein RimM [Caldilineaceae bacterium]